MRHAFLDRYSRADTPLNRIDPRVKTLLAFTIIIYVVTTPASRYLDIALIAPLLIVCWRLSGVPIRYLLKRLLGILIFITIISIGIVMTKNDGTALLLMLLAKGAAAMWTLAILTATTPFPSILKALQTIKVPSIILGIMNFLYRYVFLLIDEYERLQLGRTARAFSDSATLRLKGLAWMVGMLFIRSFERATRVYQAMLGRGFDGRIVIERQNALGTSDIVALVITLIFLGVGKYIGAIYG